MSQTNTFDITTGCDLQEVDNAVNQARKELGQRYDFKGVAFAIDLKRADNLIELAAPDPYKISALWDVLQGKLVRRGVPVRNLVVGEVAPAGGGTSSQRVTLTQGVDSDVAKRIVKFIKDRKMRAVQAAIQGEQVRVSGSSRDALQAAIAALKAENFGPELRFGNYR